MSKKVQKLFVLFLVAITVILLYRFDVLQQLSLESIKAQKGELDRLVLENPKLMMLGFLATYILCAALSIPGATVLTLASGALFGVKTGTVLVSVASTVGATLAFLVSRFLLRDWVTEKFGNRLKDINEGVKKDGAFYLLSLRLIPIFPFFLVNLVMGLTPLSTLTFFFISLLGMFPATVAYVNAGTQLSQIESLSGLISRDLLLSFALIGLLPLFSKFILDFLKKQKVYSRYKKPRKFDYNLVAIGAGAAGLVTAYIASAVKAKAAIVEKHKMGGDCLNTGCVPSKTLIKTARVAQLMRRSPEFGIEPVDVQVNFPRVMTRIREVIAAIEPHDSVARYTSMGVDCLQGTAKILSPWEIEVNGKTITTKNIVIATGARPFVPSIPGLKDVPHYTSDTVWNLPALPKQLLVLGGGAIGCEMAQAFCRLGSEVHLVERSERLLSKEDPDASAAITERLVQEGVRLYLSSEAKSVEMRNGQKTLAMKSQNKEIKIEFDEVLVALGRKPNVTGFGLEELGIEISDRGTIVVDDFLRTRFPNIFACGDVAGPYQFTHTAAHMAWYASVNALFGKFKKFRVDYRVIPWATFTDPEVARVGLSEEEAQEKKVSYEVYKYGTHDLDRAISEGEAHGFVKVLVKPGTDQILGATIVGEQASEIITEFISAMKHDIGLNKILSTIHIYPTLSEANKYAAGEWKKATQPKRLLKFLNSFHAWSR